MSLGTRLSCPLPGGNQSQGHSGRLLGSPPHLTCLQVLLQRLGLYRWEGRGHIPPPRSSHLGEDTNADKYSVGLLQ